ncbi:MAG: anhydro-N-acetylmuramic acid kinase [Planctomycetota bacterium]|jgi:anhydro-N-acetylmuramic acid kinase|nr:anhydro-N-acetylmuramic acid kinase [Planctomycetota bacterium]MDP6761706.1 anhydro-N-acetylmuramic acid kinase [Planctomycetota bacterium]MDP6990180.1 anhydro-N-acetylmuramic acid kinase [Planctomycetota bacterium]
MRELVERLERGRAVVAGVLSGTSGDGVDVGLARFAARRGERGFRLWRCEPLAFETLPFPGDLAPRVRRALDGEAGGARELALLHRDLGAAFGAAAVAVAGRAERTLDLLGSHGLTVYHHDGAEECGPASLQLGDGDFAAEAAGCCVVSDFRQRDMACGGEGAPISALADDLLFASEPRPLGVLNLGGMANLTLLPESGAETLSFDTGPAGSLLDGLARRLLDAPLDRDGACAAAGRPDEAFVSACLAHPFFDKAPPKSTGRDTFGEAWLDELCERAAAEGVWRPGEDPADLFAAAVEVVAEAVAGALARLPAAPRRLLLAGGGVHNRALVAALERRLGRPLETTAAAGVDPDGREALVFATLAARCLLGEAVTSTGATGAAQGRVLGKISPPPP